MRDPGNEVALPGAHRIRKPGYETKPPVHQAECCQVTWRTHMGTDRRVSLLPNWIIAFGKSSGASTKISPTYGFERAWHFTQQRTFLRFQIIPKQRSACQISRNISVTRHCNFIYHFILFSLKIILITFRYIFWYFKTSWGKIKTRILLCCLNYKFFNKLLIWENCTVHQMLITLFILMTCMTIAPSTFWRENSSWSQYNQQSCLLPRCQNESSRKNAVPFTGSLSCNQTQFHLKGLARGFVSNQRHKVTRKWPIAGSNF